MLKLTFTDGQRIEVFESEVVRIQTSITGVMKEGSKSRVDGNGVYDVLEEASEIAAHVKGVVGKQLGQVTLPSKNPLWFSGPKSTGPVWVQPGDKTIGIRSALIIGGKRLFVTNTPEEVRDIVILAGGAPQPVRDGEYSMPLGEDVQDWPDQLTE